VKTAANAGSKATVIARLPAHAAAEVGAATTWRLDPSMTQMTTQPLDGKLEAN
jgi:hypothetical protein